MFSQLIWKKGMCVSLRLPLRFYLLASIQIWYLASPNRPWNEKSDILLAISLIKQNSTEDRLTSISGSSLGCLILMRNCSCNRREQTTFDLKDRKENCGSSRRLSHQRLSFASFLFFAREVYKNKTRRERIKIMKRIHLFTASAVFRRHHTLDKFYFSPQSWAAIVANTFKFSSSTSTRCCSLNVSVDFLFTRNALHHEMENLARLPSNKSKSFSAVNANT